VRGHPPRRVAVARAAWAVEREDEVVDFMRVMNATHLRLAILLAMAACGLRALERHPPDRQDEFRLGAR
jgi:hypothetical protein